MSDYPEYLSALQKKHSEGIATENTYRPALHKLLDSLGEDIFATNEPKHIACGAPDFRISRKTVPIGYVETKNIGTDLDEMEKGKGPHGDQFVRYRDGLPNWILTDYLSFRWYMNGKRRLKADLGKLGPDGKIKQSPNGDKALDQLLEAFLAETALTVATAKDLAVSMAQLTRIVRAQIVETLKLETQQRPGDPIGWLHQWLLAFEDTLIPGLREDQFADMFAQTFAYGLFAARINTPPEKVFSREMAAYGLPKTNPFLRKFFFQIASVDMPDSIAWAVDGVVDLLKHADIKEILKDFAKGGGKEDPVVHFYETFLAAYDRKLRKIRGVYFTPEPVVGYIARSVDSLLKKSFARPLGLADERTLILDPATGTATFLYLVIDIIHKKFEKQAGAWNDYVARHLLRRIFGFEILMAPYAIAHLKLGMQLQDTGYKFDSDQRLGIYLTNTLEEATKRSELLFAQWVSDEANTASKIKRDEPILVVLGNPPYSNFGRMNRGPWILSLLKDYKSGLVEKKLNIDDDFIKFIRFAQWRIAKTGYGIVGYITNNTYIDGITHRRMRECLLNTFNEIYILNLHGSINRREVCPDGSKDNNVFDNIKVGTAIALFVKTPENKKCRVFYSDLWGTRDYKYGFLKKADVTTTRWNEITPSAPYFFFVRKEFSGGSEYEAGWRVTDIFPLSSSGIQTKRDNVAVAETEEALSAVLRDFSSMEKEALRHKYSLPADGRDWKIEWASLHAADILRRETPFSRLLYRPFDLRWTIIDNRAKGFVAYPRYEIMSQMDGKNLGMVLTRQLSLPTFQHILVTNAAIDGNTISMQTREYNYLFPLYTRFGMDGGRSRRPNIEPSFLRALALALNLPQEKKTGFPEGISPEDIFYYAYAILHSPNYRKRYEEFLKVDFPRVPLTSNPDQFSSLVTKGHELVGFHLLISPVLNQFITEYPQKGDNVVEKISYELRTGQVWINRSQYFSGVPRTVWDFFVGGYRVCDRWLKDRKGKELSFDDIQHYQRIIVALNETIRKMAEIDHLIPGWPVD